MWTRMMKATLLGAGFLIATAGTATAQVVEVNVPFAFVVDGQTLPAGEYRLERDLRAPSVVLLRGKQGNSVRMFVQTIEAVGTNPAGHTAALTFEPYEDEYRLTAIWESSRQGYELPDTASTGSGRFAQVLIVGERVS